MPNWCEGKLKIRGKQKDIVKFITNQLLKCDYGTNNYENVKLELSKFNRTCYEIPEQFLSHDLYVDNSRRGFVNLIDYDNYFYDDGNEDKRIYICDYRQAWDIDVELFTELSVKYNLDFKIYAYERGCCVNRDIEVIDGEIVKNETIEIEDYTWNCIDSTIGG